MIGRTLIFRITNCLKDIELIGTEFELVMPTPEKQRNKPLRGSCGSPLRVKRNNH